MIKLNNDRRAWQRIQSSHESLDPFKRKNHKLRRMVAGDFSDVLGTPTAKEDGPHNEIRVNELYDFIVTDFDESHSNRIIQSVKTILMQVAYANPDIEFEDLRSEEAAVHAGWIKGRLGDPPLGCGAKDEMRMALLDFLIGGIGWSHSCLRAGIPALRHCDTLDMSWDRTATIPTRIKWASCRYRETLHYWIQEFGEKPFKDELDGMEDESHLDHMVEMEFYYDVDLGENGSFYVFRVRGSEVDNEPIFHQDNPCYYDVLGRRVPFIPYEPLYFLALPSLSLPIGVVEMLFPSQMKLWKIETYTDKILERGAPYYQTKKGNLDTKEKKAFEDGDVGAIVEYTETPISRHEGIQLDPNTDNERAYHERQFQSHAGTNPYAQGSPVEGTNFASEVQQIASNAGLTVGFVSKDHAAFWERTCRKFIGVGALYDDEPTKIQLGDVAITFDAHRPIKMFLNPLADLVIREDSTTFRPRQQVVQEAVNDLKIALSMAQVFPNAPALAYEKYLRARGEKNIAPWLQQPAPMGMPGVAGAAPAAAGDPAAEAQQSTV